MRTPKLIIGIDPDVQKSGFAIWNTESKQFEEVLDVRLWELFGWLERLNTAKERSPIKVYMEAGYIVKRHWQKKGHGVAKSVGENQGICKAIEAFLNHLNIPYELLPPAGYSNYTHEAFCKITGWDKSIRTNSEKRAAAMMVYRRKS